MNPAAPEAPRQFGPGSIPGCPYDSTSVVRQMEAVLEDAASLLIHSMRRWETIPFGLVKTL